MFRGFQFLRFRKHPFFATGDKMIMLTFCYSNAKLMYTYSFIPSKFLLKGIQLVACPCTTVFFWFFQFAALLYLLCSFSVFIYHSASCRLTLETVVESCLPRLQRTLMSTVCLWFQSNTKHAIQTSGLVDANNFFNFMLFRSRLTNFMFRLIFLIYFNCFVTSYWKINFERMLGDGLYIAWGSCWLEANCKCLEK